MGSQHISLASSQPRRRRFGFTRQFLLSFLGILATTFVGTCLLEVVLIIFVALENRGTSIFAHSVPLQLLAVLVVVAVPFLVLFLSVLFFAWLMGRRIKQPVDELMLAVEKIRQQDLNFTIHYQGRNELGDLCQAFNELRRELQQSLEREWRKQEEMRTTIAALSHDLRTPVTIIQGHVEGLARAEAGEKRSARLERYLPVLEASSQRMARLLNDMLLVSALEQSSFLIQPQAVALVEEMERKAHVYQLQAAAQEIEFSYTYYNLAGQETPVLLDLHRLEQILDNLFENALRYTPAHGQIFLTCTRDSHSLTFVLRDTGCGIASEDLPHVFARFYHGRQQPENKLPGTAGLGLYTCKLLVEKQGGSIAIQNHPAGGCEVALCLPLHAA